MQYPIQQQQPSNPVANFFRNTNLTLAAFDIRRGQCEGDEPEKLLSFFPTVAPIHVRTSIVGLAQAVASFAETLTQDDSRFKSLAGEVHKWLMFECEPSIWLLVVVRKTWATGTCTDAALRALLTSIYDVFVLLHGKMETLLEQDPSGFSVRRVLQPLLDEVGSRLLRPDTAGARQPGGHTTLLGNPLAPHHRTAVPLLTPSHPAFLAVQCLVNQLLVASFYGTRLVAGCVVLWGGLTVWSSVGPQDTAALVALAGRALGPAAKAAQRTMATPTTLASGLALVGGAAAAAVASSSSAFTETAFETLLSPLQWRAGGGTHTPVQASTLATVAAGLGAALANTGISGFVGGSTAAAATATAAGAATPAGAGAVGSLPPPSSSPGSVPTISLLSGFGSLGGSTSSNAGGGGGGGTPPLPVSSSAASGPPVVGAAAGGGGAGVCSALPPFLSSFLRPRLRPSMYSSGPGGGGAAMVLPVEGVLPMAHVWQRGSSEWVQLLPYHRGPLMVLALLHDGPAPGTEVLAALAAVLGRGAGPAAAALAGEVPTRSVWHEKGHRYCYTDNLYMATRFSPLKKVLTLSASALRHVAHLRSKLDEWQAGQRARVRTARRVRRQGLLAGGQGVDAAAAAVGERQSSQPESTQAGPSGLAPGAATSTAIATTTGLVGRASHDPTAGGAVGAATDGVGEVVEEEAEEEEVEEEDAEVVVRTGHDAWMVLRAAPGGRRLYTASEQGPELTLASAVVPTDALCDRLFPGVFLQP